jgi:4-diphosphocytidyl-2-C-methyl-D-erythritol kinase
MQSVSLTDKVRLEAGDGPGDEVHCPGVDGDNLVAAAVARFREVTGWDGEPVRLSDKKRIPIAAGMAGGSADAAAALRLLAQHTGLGDRDTLLAIGADLGADVPAQVRPGRVLATGAGESVERVPGVARYGVLVVPAPEPLSTADVFREADRLGLPRDAGALAAAREEVRAALPDLPDALCVNELQPAALSLRPELRGTLDAVAATGADVTMVSGSGPTVLGLFRERDRAKAAVERFPGASVAKPVGPHAGEVLSA